MLLIFSFSSFFGEAQALSQPRSCTWEHLTVAVRLNQARRPLYAYWSQNQSLAVSDALIALENELLQKAVLSDFASFVFQVQGIPLLCKEYVSMDLVPRFKSHSPAPWPLLQNFKSVNIQKLSQELQTANEAKNFAAVVEISKKWLNLLQGEPHFNCLTRHFIESIARAAALAPEQEALSRQVGLSSLDISKLFIRAQMSSLTPAESIDRKAAPLQSAGIPIICQDVPTIEIPN